MNARALLLLGVTVVLPSCRTNSPEERVYTYETARPSGNGRTPPVVPPPSTLPASTGHSVVGSQGRDDGGAGPSSAADAGVEPPAEFTKHGLLEAVATCALGRYRDFLDTALALRERAKTLALSPSDANAAAARAAWTRAIASWQEAELFRLGPAAPVSVSEPGGQGLRDLIYSWPLVNACYIDEQVVNQSYLGPAFDAIRINGRGLAALEYLLFAATNDNACTQYSVINANGTWKSMPAGELAQRRADYASRAADSVVGHAETLIEAWQGSFHQQLTGPGSTAYPVDQDALNAVSAAMFYVDYELKDLKLGRPAGVYDCLNGTCPEWAESPYAHASVANIRANLVGFRRLLQGCGNGFNGLGFDDWLREVGAGDLADRMLAALDEAEREAALLSAPIDHTVVANPAKVLAMHATLKRLTDMLKTEFVTVLNLELPEAREGDND